MSYVVGCVVSTKVIPCDRVVGTLSYASVVIRDKECVCSLVVVDGVVIQSDCVGGVIVGMNPDDRVCGF